MRALVAMERRLAAMEADGSALISLPFVPHAGTFPQPFSVASDAFITATLYGKRLRLIQWSCTTDVVTTNTGGNYWTISLNSSSAVTLASFTTAADTPNVFTQHVVAASSFASIPVPASVTFILIRLAKTGAPGTLYLEPLLLARISG